MVCEQEIESGWRCGAVYLGEVGRGEAPTVGVAAQDVAQLIVMD